MAVKKVDAPLLIIGLGGTGSEAAARVKRAFAERLEIPKEKDCPRRTRFLVIDTDNSEKRKRNWKDIEFFSIANNYAAIKDHKQPWEEMWFDEDFSDPDGMLASGDGAGIYRQISRLFLFRGVDQLCTKIETAVNDVRAVEAGEEAGRKLEIRILAGISGGTGSGTILDVPYLVRYVLESRLHMSRESYALEGILVMPDVTIEHHGVGDGIKQELYQTNGYAALKEIDYWMYYESHHHMYRQKYSFNIEIEWKGRPYDDLILLNASMLRTNEVAGSTHIRNSYDHILSVIAEYLVNCFSGDYEQGNVVEYNRDGKSQRGNDDQPTDGSNQGAALGASTMTFDAMRINDMAQLRAIRKEYFVPYCYRSIGAFSNTGDMANILNRQWNMILDATILRIDRRESVANMEGTAPITLKTACIDKGVGVAASSALRTFYEEKHAVNDVFGNMTAADLRVRNYSNAPHGDEFEAWKETLTQQKGDDQLALEKKGRELLHSALTDVVCDLERGPQHCYDLLAHPIQGLIVALEEEKKNAQSKKLEADAFVRDYSGASGICSGIMTEMKNLGIIRWGLESARRFDQYKESVIDLYNAAQASNYYAALYDAMTELIKYVEEYKNLLGDIINGLRARQTEYRKRVNAAKENTDAAIRLLDDGKLEQSLTDAFNEQQRMEGLVQSAYKTVAESVDKAQAKNQTSYTEREVAELIREGIDALRRDCFSKIDNMDIETKLKVYGTARGDDMAEYTEKQIMPTLERGATPMFNSKGVLSPERKNVVMSYMGTVPADANGIIAGIVKYIGARQSSYANLKKSNIPDRLFWVTSIVGMPMMEYAGLSGMYDTYLAKRKSHSAHLCMNQNHTLDNAQLQDWSLLPEPTCHRYSNLTDVEKEAQAIHESGVLEIEVRFHNENNKYVPGIIIQRKRLNSSGPAPYITISDMEKSIEEALKGKSDLDTRISALQELRGNYTLETIMPDNLMEKAQAWAIVLGVGTDVNTTINAGLPDTERERLQNAWRISYERAVYEYVSRRPQLLAEMRVNKACFEMIDKRIADEQTPDLRDMEENTVIYGKMFRFGLIRESGAGGEFVSDEISKEDSVIYDGNDTKREAILERLLTGFVDFPLPLQSMMCYVLLIGGRSNTDQILRERLTELEADYTAILKTLPPTQIDPIELDPLEKKLPGLKSFIKNACDLNLLIQSNLKMLKQLYSQSKITDDDRTLITGILNRTLKENDKFLKRWENSK